MRQARLVATAFAVAVGVASFGCHRTITKLSWPDEQPPIPIRLLGRDIYDAISDLGFVREAPGLMSKRYGVLPSNGVRFEGDLFSAHVQLSGDPMEIWVRGPWDEDTEFTREVQRRIEQVLSEKYGLNDVKFRRRIQFIVVPNS